MAVAVSLRGWVLSVTGVTPPESRSCASTSMSSLVVFDSSSDFLHGLPPGQNPFAADHVVGHVEAEATAADSSSGST